MKRASFMVRCVGEEWVGSGCWNPSTDGRGITPSILWINHHLFLQDALPKRGAFFRIQVYERVGISPVGVYEMVGKSVIWVCEKAKKG